MCPGISLHMLQLSPRAELSQRLWIEECPSHLGKGERRPHQKKQNANRRYSYFDAERRHTEINNNPNEAIGEREHVIQNRRVTSWPAPERIKGFTTPKSKVPASFLTFSPSHSLVCTRHNHVNACFPDKYYVHDREMIATCCTKPPCPRQNHANSFACPTFALS